MQRACSRWGWPSTGRPHPDCLHCPWLAQPGAPRRSHSLQSYLGISRQPSSSRRSHQCSGACVHMMSNLFLSLPNDTYYLLRMVYTIDIRINRWCFHHLLSCFFLMITLANTVPFCSPSNNKPIRCNFASDVLLTLSASLSSLRRPHCPCYIVIQIPRKG
jgi:hypothetical protein